MNQIIKRHSEDPALLFLWTVETTKQSPHVSQIALQDLKYQQNG